MKTTADNDPGAFSRRAFSLIEVALALGVFAVAIVAILGLVGPAVEDVEDVRLAHRANDVIAELGSVLQVFDADANPATPAFSEWFSRVRRRPAVVYVYRGRHAGLVVTPDAAGVVDAAERVFAARLSVSGANPRVFIRASREGTFSIPDYTADTFPEAVLALRVDLHEMPPPAPGAPFQPVPPTDANHLLTYHTAVTR